jgi:hypothetical protein
MEYILYLLDEVENDEQDLESRREEEDVGDYCNIESSQDESSDLELGPKGDADINTDSEGGSGEDSDSSFYSQGYTNRAG